jgi:hypothetical protein
VISAENIRKPTRELQHLRFISHTEAFSQTYLRRRTGCPSIGFGLWPKDVDFCTISTSSSDPKWNDTFYFYEYVIFIAFFLMGNG